MDYSKYILIFIWFIWDALFILVILINSAESFTYNLFSDFSATHPLYKSPIALYSRSALLDWDHSTGDCCFPGRRSLVQIEIWFFTEFACSPHAYTCFLWVLQFPPTVQKHVRSIGFSKWPLSVSVCKHYCLSCASLFIYLFIFVV